MVFQPNLYLLCIVCLPRLHEGDVQRLQFMSAIRGEANNVHLVFPSTVHHPDIPRMSIMSIQCQDNWILFRQLHKRDKMFEPLRKAVFLDPSSLVISCYWTWWSSIRSSAFMLLLGNTKRGGAYVTVAFIRVTIVTSEPCLLKTKWPVILSSGRYFAYFMLNDSETRFFIVE